MEIEDDQDTDFGPTELKIWPATQTGKLTTVSCHVNNRDM